MALSVFRKLPKEVRIEIWTLTIVDPLPQHERNRQLSEDAKIRKAGNVAPKIIEVFRSHHDRELYFEALDVYHRLFPFQLGPENWYGKNVSARTLHRFQHLELSVDDHFCDFCCNSRRYMREAIRVQDYKEWIPRHDIFASNKRITLNLKDYVFMDRNMTIVILIGLRRIHRVVMQSEPWGSDAYDEEGGPLEDFDDDDIVFYNALFETKGKLSSVRNAACQKEWFWEREDGEAFEIDYTSLFMIERPFNYTTLARWIKVALEYNPEEWDTDFEEDSGGYLLESSSHEDESEEGSDEAGSEEADDEEESEEAGDEDESEEGSDEDIPDEE